MHLTRDVWTWKRSLSHQPYVDISLPRRMEATDRRKLVAKREFNNPMDKHAVKVVGGNETLGHLPREFSRIAWYFLASSGEINVEVIGRRRHCKQLCGEMESSFRRIMRLLPVFTLTQKKYLPKFVADGLCVFYGSSSLYTRRIK